MDTGKIKVKIVTSKEVLENMGDKNDVKLLSEREETQFRDMILGLLVSCNIIYSPLQHTPHI